MRVVSRLSAATLAVGLVVFSVVVLGIQVAAANTDAVTSCSGSPATAGSLPYEVEIAASGDTITFAVSCPSASPIVLSNTIDIDTNLTIEGSGVGTDVISGNNAVEVFDVVSGVTATISGLTVEDGNESSLSQGDPQGGGILNDGSLTVSSCLVSDNVAGLYGGAISTDGPLTVIESSISGNSAEYGIGGGIYVQSGSVMVTNSTLSGNYGANDGGGIDTQSGALTLVGSTVSGNSTSESGGGILDGDAPLTLVDSTVSDNKAEEGGGGGILGASGGIPATITDSTVSGNISSGGIGGGIAFMGIMAISDSSVTGNSVTGAGIRDIGGGILNDGTVTLTASTVADNAAVDGTGGNITTYPSATTTMTMSIVADSTAGSDCSGNITDDGYNLDDDGSCGLHAEGDLSDTPAGLEPSGLQNNGGPTQTIALEPGSAAIDAVNDATLCSTPDQRGVTRSTPCDIGAVELVLIPQTITFTSTPPPDATVGGPSYTVSTAGGMSGNPVTFAVDPPSQFVCGISGAVVTFVGAGTCTIDANQAGNADDAPAVQIQQSFSVSPPATCVFISPARAAGTAGEAFTFVVLTNVCSPSPTIAGTGLPSWLTLTDDHDGYATLAAKDPLKGKYHFTLMATNAAGTAKQKFVLRVKKAKY